MSRVVHHRDGSRTVYFSDGRKATFGRRRTTSPKCITGTPYIFAKGAKIELPEGVAHGMIFEHRGKTYVAVSYRGRDALGRRAGACYGQPITLTRPIR